MRMFDEYQEAALRTYTPTNNEMLNLCLPAMGLAGEAGEFSELMKKHVFHGHELARPKVVKELGDVLWYLAVAAHQHGISLSEIAMHNIDKLKVRYPEGFDSKRSHHNGE